MGALRSFMIAAAFGLLCAAVAATAQAEAPAGYRPFVRPAGLGGSAAQPQAPAMPPSRAPAMRQPGWIQREGYVPVPDALLKPDTPAASDPNTLPAANQWAVIDLDKPFAEDPLGTNVYADTNYAPANVRAAIENKEDSDPTASVWAKPPASMPGGMSSGMGGGMGGGVGASQGAMLQQSFAPTAPVAAAPQEEVFTGGSNGFNNRYQASVANAMGSSDLMVQMIVEAPEQQVALGSDAIRQIMGQRTNTLPNRIFVYSTRTINNPNGQPFTAITYLMKNNVDAERSRQASTFGSSDMMPGIIADVARATKLKISPGSLKVSNAVNDGGLNAPAAPGAGLPMALPGQMPAGGQMMPGAGMGAVAPGGMTGAAAAPAAAAPAAPAKSSANGAAAGVLTAGAVLLAALLVF